MNNRIIIERRSNLFIIPLLVVSCFCFVLIGLAFSSKLSQEELDSYNVEIKVIDGGELVSVVNRTSEGSFSEQIDAYDNFESITCNKGNLEYDPLLQRVYTEYVNRDISCVIVFGEDNSKKLAADNIKPINDDYGTSYYFNVDVDNNYVKLNDMMFRIVRVNGDGTLRIILIDSPVYSSYGEKNSFDNSNIKWALEEWYNQNFADADYVVTSYYDADNYPSYDSYNLISYGGYYMGKVGTLSVRELALILGENLENNYLKDNEMLLLNGNGISEVYAYIDNSIVSVESTRWLNVKPVINIKEEALVGLGTIDEPYVLKED